MNKFTKLFVGTLCALALVAATATYAADTVAASPKASVTQTAPAEEWVLSLGGVGASETDPSDTTFGIDLSVGRTGKWLLPNEYGVRQSFSYADDDVTFNTRLYNDWTVVSLFNKKVDLFAGAFMGLEYGNQKPSWEIAPEAGARWWIKEDVAVLGRVEVPWDLAEWEFKDTIRYFLGFQVKL